MVRGEKISILVVRGQKILISGGPGIQNIDLVVWGHKTDFFKVWAHKLLILVALTQKISIFGGPERGPGKKKAFRPANNSPETGGWGEGREGGTTTLVLCN